MTATDQHAQAQQCEALESGGVRCDLTTGHLDDGVQHWIAPSNIEHELAGNGYAPPAHGQIDRERDAFLATRHPTTTQPLITQSPLSSGTVPR
ncbi:MAG: hypothetical protein WKF57_05925 [Nakamurella sp.]